MTDPADTLSGCGRVRSVGDRYGRGEHWNPRRAPVVFSVMRLHPRATLAVAALAVALQLGTGAALGSCVQQGLDEQARSAEVIVVGVVTETRQTFAVAGGAIRFRPELALKGTLAREVQVYLGPTRGGAVTSVDYRAVTTGERHTLYLRAAEGDSYETSACSGSHVGAATAEESRLLGPGTAVVVPSAGSVSPLAAGVVAIVSVLVAAAVLLRLRRRDGAA